MKVVIKYDDMDNEIYQISKTQLIIRDDKFKLYQLVKGSYEFQGDVLKKNYKEIKASNRKRLCYLVEFQRKDKTIIKLIHTDDLDKEEKKQQKAESKYLLKVEKEEIEKEILNKAKIDFRKSIRALYGALEAIDLSEMDLKEIEQYDLYLLNIIKKVKTKNIKDISTTKQIKRDETIELYKNKIYNYMTEGKFFSINQMCKDLKINRKSFYNYKLNEYLEEIKI